MAVDNSYLKEKSDKELQAMGDAASSGWHIAGTQEEKDDLHQLKTDIMAELDSRNGATSTFDSGSGLWSTTGEGSSAKETGGSSGDAFSPSKSLGVSSEPYFTDDYGGMDYSALLQAAPQYQPTEMDKTAEALVRTALEMNYTDWTKGDQYAALSERYGQQGQRSMRDTLGQVSARTGGLASSYAGAAAQQSYNQYMSQLEQAAMEMYGVERADALQKAQLAYQFADRDYQRYLDQLSQYNADRSFGFGVLDQVLQNSYYDREWQNTLEQQAYQRERDMAGDAWQQKNFDWMVGQDAYGKGLTAQDDARGRIAQFISMGGQLEQLDPSLIEAGQYTPEELAVLGQYYAPQQQPRQGQYIRQGTQAGGGPTFNNGKLTKEQVKKLQAYLNSTNKGGAAITEDGFWEPASQTAAGGKQADELWKEYQGGGRSYDELVNTIDHINPGVTDAQLLKLLEVIEEAQKRETITQAQYEELGRKLGAI